MRVVVETKPIPILLIPFVFPSCVVSVECCVYNILLLPHDITPASCGCLATNSHGHTLYTCVITLVNKCSYVSTCCMLLLFVLCLVCFCDGCTVFLLTNDRIYHPFSLSTSHTCFCMLLFLCCTVDEDPEWLLYSNEPSRFLHFWGGCGR